MAEVLRRQEWVAGVEIGAEDPQRVSVRTAAPETAHLRLPGLLAEAGCGLVSMDATRHGLEEAFLRAVGEAGDGARSQAGGRRAAAAPQDGKGEGGPR